MRILKKSYVILAVVCLMTGTYSCSKKWDLHNEITDPVIKDNLFDQLSKNSEVSEFGKLLVKSGYDKILASSKTFTVFAPDNAAIASMDPGMIADTASLNNFIANHIALTAYRTDAATDSLSLRMLNGKNILFLNANIGDADITQANKFAANGIYHVISSIVKPKSNIWQYLQSNAASNHQAAFIGALDSIHIYPNGLSDVGEPLLDNEFIKETYNIKDETKKFTVFLMQNSAFDTETNKLLPYFVRPGADTTQFLAKHYTMRDLIFDGEYKQSELPDTLVSKFGVKVGINRASIVERVSLSNGVIYVMSDLSVNLQQRLVTSVIEGENPRVFIPGDKRGNIYYRKKIDPFNVLFHDLMVQNHGIPLFEVGYTTPVLFSTKYKVYWRAINDIQTNVFQQRLMVGGIKDSNGTLISSIAFYPYTNVNVANYNEVYLGEFTLNTAGNVPLALIAANNNSTSSGVNTLSLDYVKLVPVIK